jgi:hypothetical protein
MTNVANATTNVYILGALVVILFALLAIYAKKSK